MAKRHKKLGIKQTIQRDWMDRTLLMLQSGLSEKEIRNELDDYLSTQKQSGGIGERGQKTYGMALSILASWFAPDYDLIPFRDDALGLSTNLLKEERLALHWAVISASYPFWHNVALQVGRLLNLQDKVTQSQVFDRLKEQYGDRETVARNARYTVRSFVAWGVLKDTDKKGHYVKSEPVTISDERLVALLLESGLHANESGKTALNILMNSPAFFPFDLPVISGSQIQQNSKRVFVDRLGLDEEYLWVEMGSGKNS